MIALSIPEPWLYAAIVHGLAIPFNVDVHYRGTVLLHRTKGRPSKKVYAEIAARIEQKTGCIMPMYKSFRECVKDVGLVGVAKVVDCVSNGGSFSIVLKEQAFLRESIRTLGR